MDSLNKVISRRESNMDFVYGIALRLLVIIILMLFVLSACTDNLVETNTNPNSPNEVPGEFLLANAEVNGVDQVNGSLDRALISLLVQNLARIHSPEPDRFQRSSYVNAANSAWSTFYERLENLHLIKNKASNSEKPNLEAVATILMVWNYQIMTDMWGDIPYSEALTGMEDEKIIQPKYDTQESIYDDLIQKLNTATSLIEESTSSFGQKDVIYNGNMTAWLKFGNSLKLRIYMRMSEVDPTTAKNGIAEVYANNKIFENNADNAVFNYGSYPYNHPTNDAMRDRYDFRVSKTIIDTLKIYNDPRIRIYAFPTKATGEYRGVPNGAEDQTDYQLDMTSILGGYFASPTTPGYILRYTEVQFILAEAAARGWIQEDPEKMYNKAIRASMQEFSNDRLNSVLDALRGDRVYSFQGLNSVEFPQAITESEMDKYLSQPTVQYDQSTWREQIGFQKWIALFGQGLQSWMSWRRLNYPQLELPEASNLTQFPVRLFYPTSEKSLNNANYQEAISRQGTDNLLTPLWWDVD